MAMKRGVRWSSIQRYMYPADQEFAAGEVSRMLEEPGMAERNPHWPVGLLKTGASVRVRVNHAGVAEFDVFGYAHAGSDLPEDL